MPEFGWDSGTSAPPVTATDALLSIGTAGSLSDMPGSAATVPPGVQAAVLPVSEMNGSG